MEAIYLADPTAFALQKINDTYPFGSGHDLIIIENGVPVGLDGDSALDYIEETGITDTSEAEQISETFVMADLVPLTTKYISGIAKCVAHVECARTGATGGTVYITKVTFTLGTINSSALFTSIADATATPAFSNTTTSYDGCDVMAYIDIGDQYEITSDAHLALKVQVYGYIATTENAKMKLCVTRGSFDSYIELFMGR